MELVNSFTNALDWIKSNLNEFDPFYNGRNWDVIYGQRLSELAVLVYCLRKNKTFKDRYFFDFLDFLKRISKNERFKDRVFRCPSEFVLYCDLYAILSKLGVKDVEQFNALKKVISINTLDAVERTPHRIMDVALSLEMAEIGKDWHKVNNVIKTTILSKNFNLCSIYEDSAYAITHVILFAYGFGNREYKLSSQAEYQKLYKILSTLMIDFVLQNHWDLVSEFIICWNCLKFPHNNLYKNCQLKLIQQQYSDGAFPGPKYDIDLRKRMFKNRKEKEAAQHSFHHCYHTTLTSTLGISFHMKRRMKTTLVKDELFDQYKPGDEISEALTKCHNFFAHKLSMFSLNKTTSQDYSHLAWILLGFTFSRLSPEMQIPMRIKEYIDTIIAPKENKKLSTEDLDILALAGIFLSSYDIHVNYYDQFVKKIMFSEDCDIYEKSPLSSQVLNRIGLLKGSGFRKINSIGMSNGELEEEIKNFVSISFLKALDGKKLSSKMVNYLEGYALYCIKKYNWLEVFKVINILIISNHVPIHIVEFMLIQQRDNGSFGYWGPEFSISKNTLDEDEREIYVLTYTFQYILVLLNLKTKGELMMLIYNFLGVC